MGAEPFVYADANGIRRVMHPVDHDSFVVETVYDADPILESIKRDKENVQRLSTNKLVARVPISIYEKSLLEQWDEDDWKKWLNRSENKVFRVWDGDV